MYGEVKENNKLIYASDLVNSYAWDTAIIFIQTYGTGEDASDYASKNKSTSFANTGINNDRYCNIFDMSGNAYEWTTEYSTYSGNSHLLPLCFSWRVLRIQVVAKPAVTRLAVTTSTRLTSSETVVCVPYFM